MSEEFAKIEKLSAEVLRLSRNTILINLRFMDAALAELKSVPSMLMRGMATDGKRLIYNPMDILKAYADERYVINRDYLHMLLHCLYRHNFVNELLDEAVWDLACDIAVENIINQLSIPSLDAKRASQQVRVISELKNNVKILTAEKIYRYYLDKKVSLGEVEKIRDQFFADDHALWYQKDDGQSANDDQDGDSESGENSLNDSNGKNIDSQIKEDYRERQAQEERWKEISERMQQDLETFSKDRGDAAGSLVQNLGEVNREKYDYTAFLKKFAVMGEAMKINDDEFDYVFYTYGLKLYKKMPLIEPLEYKDVKRIREFAIVIP